jgi:hypothetical protein
MIFCRQPFRTAVEKPKLKALRRQSNVLPPKSTKSFHPPHLLLLFVHVCKGDILQPNVEDRSFVKEIRPCHGRFMRNVPSFVGSGRSDPRSRSVRRGYDRASNQSNRVKHLHLLAVFSPVCVWASFKRRHSPPLNRMWKIVPPSRRFDRATFGLSGRCPYGRSTPRSRSMRRGYDRAINPPNSATHFHMHHLNPASTTCFVFVLFSLHCLYAQK